MLTCRVNMKELEKEIKQLHATYSTNPIFGIEFTVEEKVTKEEPSELLRTPSAPELLFLCAVKATVRIESAAASGGC